MRDQPNRMFPTPRPPGFAGPPDQQNRMFAPTGFMGDFGQQWNPYTQPPAPPRRLPMQPRRVPMQPMSRLPGQTHQMPGGGFMEGPSHNDQAPMMFGGRR